MMIRYARYFRHYAFHATLLLPMRDTRAARRYAGGAPARLLLRDAAAARLRAPCCLRRCHMLMIR